MALDGLIVKHTHHGLGKIEKENENHFSVEFLESGGQALFERSAFEEHELKRFTLPLKSICVAEGRNCVVEELSDHGGSFRPKRYVVTFDDDGLRAEVSECSLIPTGSFAQLAPIEKLLNQDQGSYSLFGPREKLITAINRQLKNGNGLRALLSSRIDLRPHQAYVAGVILLDQSRRYLLADEVGLGKTIEAGIVIHDLLMNKPDANILILCPGALTQQWLCEIYSKFSGQVFRMLEMMDAAAEDWSRIHRLIASFSDAGLRQSTLLQKQEWDLVVVDEAHHLLSSQTLYQFVHTLSQKTPSILLLSALPAKRREDEFLRLLALLEPDRYTDTVVSDKQAFKQLFDDQRAIGRKLRLIRRRLDGIHDGSFTREETIDLIKELNDFALIAKDPEVTDSISRLPRLHGRDFNSEANQLLHTAGDRYRINRRILRNRRQRLIEDDQISEITRETEEVGFESEQLEHEVNDTIHDLLNNAILSGISHDLVEVFAGTIWQSTAHPTAVCDLLRLIRQVQPGNLNAKGHEYLRLGHLNGMASWESYVELLCQAIKPFISEELLQACVDAAKRWNRDPTSYSRLSALQSFLKKHSRRKPKILVFAGYPGVAELISDELRTAFGADSTTEFLSGLAREEKESNVHAFRTNPSTWLMVSDESGGEGRNFQFADMLVHYDTPWNVSRIEQRIGRLDRLGRTPSSNVISVLLYDTTSVEAGLIHCFRDGLGVYHQSISGLEFALREVECNLVQRAIESGRDGLITIIEDIKDTVEVERDRDDSEAVLDEASFDRKTADGFLRVRSSEEAELALEQAFLDFFKMVASSARSVSDPTFHDGLWMFDGGRIHQLRNTFTNHLANRTFQGSFRRAIAQERVDLDFFGLGNELFEAIYHSLHVENLGRTYAIEIVTSDYSAKWAGFEYIFFPQPNLELIDDNVGLQNQARQYFSFKPIHVFCALNGQIASDAERLLSLRQSLLREDKGTLWNNFTGHKARQLAGLFHKKPWEQVVRQNCSTAREHAAKECTETVTPIVEESLDLLTTQIAHAKRLHADTCHIEPLEQLHQAITQWSVELDSLGFLSVNTGVAERLRDG